MHISSHMLHTCLDTCLTRCRRGDGTFGVDHDEVLGRMSIHMSMNMSIHILSVSTVTKPSTSSLKYSTFTLSRSNARWKCSLECSMECTVGCSIERHLESKPSRWYAVGHGHEHAEAALGACHGDPLGGVKREDLDFEVLDDARGLRSQRDGGVLPKPVEVCGRGDAQREGRRVLGVAVGATRHGHHRGGALPTCARQPRNESREKKMRRRSAAHARHAAWLSPPCREHQY